MKIEVILLGKNYYDMDGNRGASVIVYGDNEVTNNSAGVSISNASIEFNEHQKLEVFPAYYQADLSFVSRKSRSGKDVTTAKLANLVFKEELVFIGV